MKKIYIFAAVLALLTLSLNAQMQAPKKVATQQATSTTKVKQSSIDLNFYKQELTNTQNGPRTAPNRANASVIVCDGTATSSYVPFWGLYFDDNYQIDQMIYPESLLTDLVGKTITSITFYANNNISSNLNSGRFTFKIGTTSQTIFSSPITRITTGMTTVATGMLMSNCISGPQLVIDFSDNPFTYQGGNLVLDYELTTRASGYNTTTFYGENGHDNASFYGRSTSNSTNSYGVYSNSIITGFLPKVAFGIVSNDPIITASTNSVILTSALNESATESVTVTGSNLTGGITATISGTDAALFSVSPASLGTSGGDLTVTYSPSAVGAHTATLTLSSTGAQDVTINLNGTCSNEKDLTVCDGQYYAQYLPVYGYYHDEAQHNQMVYPASILGSSMTGNAIKSMTFYPTTGSVTWNNGTTESASGINFRNGTVCFKLANIPSGSGSFDANNPTFVNATLTEVKTVSMPSSANTSATTWVITFDQEFTYTGGDLLIDVTNPTTGNWGLTFFTVDATNDYYGYLTSGAGNAALNYLPKVTFTYEDAMNRHDLALALDAQPATVAAGGNVTLTATVTNNGNFDETGYTVTFTANGTTIDTQTANTNLPVGQSTTFTYTYTTTDAQGGTTVNFTAVVTCNGDEIVANDEASASTSVVTLLPPINVAAAPNGTNATVTWDAPNIPSVQQNLTWDFEASSQVNDWTLVDSDGDGYTWRLAPYNTDSFEPHGGTGDMSSASFINNIGVLTPDNWMISPEVTLGGTFTFWAKGTDDTYYAENFGVFVYEGSYSSGTSGFVQVGSDYTATNGWIQYTVDLSQYSGQGRIAIRHYNCTNQYWLLVDDINYQATVPGEQPTSYNIYLDGQLVGSVNANDPLTYDFSNLSDGQHTAEISAVYALGESALVPAQFTIVSTNPELAISPADQTIDDNAAGTLTVTGTDIDGNIIVSAANDWYLNPNSLSSTGGDVNVSYTGRALSATTTVTASATGATDATATVNYVADLYIVGDFGTGWDFNNGTHMSYNNGIYTATLTANANSYILFARLLGNSNPWNTRDVFGPDSNGNWTMQGNSYGGNLNLNASNCIHFPEGGTYTVTIDATNGTFTITKLSENQTATPVITYTDDGEYVTITATGDGTVTLTVGGQTVSGEGSASITIPYGPAATTVTATATAQEDGKDESAPATQQVPIPGGGEGWTEMDGTYDNPADLLSFLKDGEDIMMVDQFLASTLNNDHPDHYTYTLRQTVNGETKTSTPVEIPVYKTNSSIQGLYTQTQIEEDVDMRLRANVVNSEMDYDVNPDHNVLYYSLYRGEVDADYPAIDVQSRISQLQKFEDNVDGNIQYYMFENHQTGVAPRYDRLGNEIAERLDTNWVACNFGDQISYVPVIWTFGLYSGREDGKNNSYGSDIKREKLGAVSVSIEGKHSDGSVWGKFTVGDVEYCIYHPIIHIEGSAPVNVTTNDGDVITYEPYMYRAWCTYEGMRDFKAGEDGALADNGPLAAPYLLGEEVTTNAACHIGEAWTQGDGRLQSAFAVPVGVPDNEVTFVVRFYYKKTVVEQSNGNKLRLGNGEGEEYYIAQGEGDGEGMVTGIIELMNGATPVSVTYVNMQGMKSDQPFDGVNIVVTRYSDGSTVTRKVVR